MIPLIFLTVNAVQAAAPKIKSVNVTPTSAPVGTMFKFSVILDAPLTTGNKVKIDFGKGLASMIGTKTSYSLSRAIYATGVQTYKAGIYNAKNVLQGKVSSDNYTVSSKTNAAPTLTSVIGDDIIEQGQSYVLQVKASDVDNNLKNVSVDWKDDSPVEIWYVVENNKLLTFSHVYSSISGSVPIEVKVSDTSQPSLSNSVTKTVNVIPLKSSRYTKVCNSGALEGEEDCPVSPFLGAANENWGCTQDNETGLIWEMKTNDRGIHDYRAEYTNFTPEWNVFSSDTDATGFVRKVNSNGLCGASDWRLPTLVELSRLIYCSDGKYDTLSTYPEGYDRRTVFLCKSNDNYADVTTKPTIENVYFPNTGGFYWTRNLYSFKAESSGYPFFGSVNFDYGTLSQASSGFNFRIRLVRGNQTIKSNDSGVETNASTAVSAAVIENNSVTVTSVPTSVSASVVENNFKRVTTTNPNTKLDTTRNLLNNLPVTLEYMSTDGTSMTDGTRITWGTTTYFYNSSDNSCKSSSSESFPFPLQVIAEYILDTAAPLTGSKIIRAPTRLNEAGTTVYMTKDIAKDGVVTTANSNLYSVINLDVFIQTNYCSESVYLDNAVLTSSTLKFSNGISCDVIGFWRKITQVNGQTISGNYTVSDVSRDSNNLYKVRYLGLDFYIKTSSCLEKIFSKDATLLIGSVGTGTITFYSGYLGYLEKECYGHL